jgi:flagellar basal-body rod protein FlgB
MSEPSTVTANWLGRAVQVLSRTLDLRAQRHAVISGNLANLDTPGYIPRELTFEGQLQQVLGHQGLQPKRTDARHLPPGPEDGAGVQGRLRLRRDYALGNGSYYVDLDREMARLAQNDLLYETTVQLLAKRLSALRLAIIEGGK